jgi:hypothetical protein
MGDRGTRFYKPTLATLRNKELMFAQEKLARYYSFDEEIDRPVFDFVADGEPKPIQTRRIGMRGSGAEPEFSRLGDFQITYNFSSAARKNNFPTKAGGKGLYGDVWSFRLLYEFLSDVYNGGTPFIDTYFARVFKTRRVYRNFLDMQTKIRDDMNNEQADMLASLVTRQDGMPDMRYTASKRYMDFKLWKDPIFKSNCEELAAAIREDIINCLRFGILVRRAAAKATRQKRQKFPTLHPDQLFYASGQLIKHVNIFVELDKRRTA